jgi:hypothetical protein
MNRYGAGLGGGLPRGLFSGLIFKEYRTIPGKTGDLS